MKVPVRIYRTHDYDLMALWQTGALKLDEAMRKAIVAYYKKEYFRFNVEMDAKPDVSRMPSSIRLNVEINEADAPGITEWFSGFYLGFRNSCCKTILRHYLSNTCVGFYRDDNGAGDPPMENAETVTLKKKKRNKKQITGSEWVDMVAEGKTNGKRGAKPRNIDEILGDKQETVKNPKKRDKIAEKSKKDTDNQQSGNTKDNATKITVAKQEENKQEVLPAAGDLETTGKHAATEDKAVMPAAANTDSQVISENDLPESSEIPETDADDFDAFAAFEEMSGSGKMVL